jgi:DnaJ-class molecular chaperone
MSIIEKEYNSINFKEKSIPTFYNEVNVSILDILGENEVEVNSKDYKDCLCKSSNNLPEYFKACDKCNSKGIITLNKREVTCNKCKGEKYLRIRECYLCNNNSKILMDSKVKIKLNNTYKQGDKIELKYDDYNLVLTLNVYDKNDYYIKNNDVYYLRGINYSVNDYKEKKNVVINTVKGKEFVKSEFKIKKEIVCLKNKGIGDGNFYLTFINEVKEEVKTVYSNVIINKSGYVDVNELIKDTVVVAKEYVNIDSNNYVYINENINEVLHEDYLIKLNKLSNDYRKEKDNVVIDVYLEKEDLNNDRKTIYLDDEKVTISYRKNLKEIDMVEAFTKLVLDKQGKKYKMLVCVHPYFENVYKIRIKNNKNVVVYVEDYKRNDNAIVETLKSNKYLEDYIKIVDENELVIGNDLVRIERV